MSIIRVRKDARYFTASNEPFNDVRLSWETRGLMGYLLSKPNNWQVRIEALEKAGPAKNYKIRRMLAEARQYGYMNRIRITLTGGKFDWITEVFESPSLNPNPSTSYRKSTSGLPTSGSSTSGEPPNIVITESESTELVITEELAATAKLFQSYESNIGAITPIIADILKDAMQDFGADWIIESFEIAAENNKRNWRYCAAILDRWKREGKDEGRKSGKVYSQNKTKERAAVNPQKYVTGEYAEFLAE